MNILEISAKLNIGGAQAVAANICKYADETMRFYYVVFGDDVGEYEKDIISRGHTVIHMKSPKGNVLRYCKSLTELMKKEKIDVVHSHTMFNCGFVMFAGWLAGVPGRISHSHTINDDAKSTFFRKQYKNLMRLLMKRFGTDWCACGISAGNILYGEKWFNQHGTVIRNGIDVDRYKFDDDIRKQIRNQYSIDNKFAICHIGHYVTVKNQVFLIRMMKPLLESKPDAVLLLFGEGEDRELLKKEIENLGLEKSVFLMGNVNNISEILSAMDVFVFPSLFEGTPLALIEAQTNGISCVISDAVPEDACITENVIKLSLQDDINNWINAVLNARRNDPLDAVNQVSQNYGTIMTSMQTLYSIFEKYKKD